jgi:hypothetical protein
MYSREKEIFQCQIEDFKVFIINIKYRNFAMLLKGSSSKRRFNKILAINKDMKVIKSKRTSHFQLHTRTRNLMTFPKKKKSKFGNSIFFLKLTLKLKKENWLNLATNPQGFHNYHFFFWFFKPNVLRIM